MQHGKCQWKFAKGSYNVIQKVQTLPASEDKNTGIEHLSKASKRDLGSITFTQVLPVLVQPFGDFNSFLWVFIKLTGFYYIWNRNIP